METFDELITAAIRYEDVKHNYAARHLRRRDIRRAYRNAWLHQLDAQLAIGGIIAASVVFVLFAIGLVVVAL